jgi:hypothetical protein
MTIDVFVGFLLIINNKLPEDGILNVETCRSEKRIILNDN